MTVVSDANANKLNIQRHSYNNDSDFVIIELDDEIKQNQIYVIRMEFISNLRDGLDGFLKKVYKNRNGENE